jgi:hypothetical protein
VPREQDLEPLKALARTVAAEIAKI